MHCMHCMHCTCAGASVSACSAQTRFGEGGPGRPACGQDRLQFGPWLAQVRLGSLSQNHVGQGGPSGRSSCEFHGPACSGPNSQSLTSLTDSLSAACRMPLLASRRDSVKQNWSDVAIQCLTGTCVLAATVAQQGGRMSPCLAHQEVRRPKVTGSNGPRMSAVRDTPSSKSLAASRSFQRLSVAQARRATPHGQVPEISWPGAEWLHARLA